MKTIRFTRNTDPEREGGPGYKQGDIVELTPNVADRWLRRDAAEFYIPAPAAQEPGPGAGKPAEPSKEELQAQCTELGIEFDSRWGVKKLQEAIEAHGAKD